MVRGGARYGSFAKHLGPAFQSAGITTRILLYDHNPDVFNPMHCRSWKTRPRVNMSMEQPFTVMAAQASAMTEVHTAYPHTNLYMTEQSISSGPNEPLPHCRRNQRRADSPQPELEPQRTALESRRQTPITAPIPTMELHTGCQGAITLGRQPCHPERGLLCNCAFLSVRATRLSTGRSD